SGAPEPGPKSFSHIPGTVGAPPSGRRRGAGLAHAIADAADGLNQPLALAAVDLLAQSIDVDVDDVGGEVEGVPPDAGLDLGARNDLAAPPEKQLEERALPNRETNRLAGPRDLAGLRLVGQV